MAALAPLSHAMDVMDKLDYETFESLVNDHREEVWWFLRYLGCDDSLADDLAQDAFSALLEGSFEYVSSAATRAYLKTTARRLLIDHSRRERRRVDLEDLEGAAHAWDSHMPTSDFSPAIEALEGCLGTLEGRARDALTFQHRDALTRKEIAASLSMSEAALKKMLYRSKLALAECIRQRLNNGRE